MNPTKYGGGAHPTWSTGMGIEEHLGYNVLTTTLEKLVDWGRKS